MEKFTYKYRNDPTFRSLADLMESFLLEKRLTVLDLFSAALIASTKYNQTIVAEIMDVDKKIRDEMHAAMTYGMAFVKDGKIIPPLEIYKEKEDKNEAD